MDEGHSSTGVIPRPPERPDVTKATWRWWEALVVFVIAVVVGGVLSAPFLGADSEHIQELAPALLFELALGGTAFLWLWFLHRRSLSAIGLPERPAREIGIGALAGVVIYAVGVFLIGTLVVMILQQASSQDVDSPSQLPEHLRNLEILLAAMTVLIAAPVAEEFFFRGFLFRGLRARLSFVPSASFSSIAFGLVHYQGGAWQDAWLLPIVMFFVGFGLAWLYERRRNIVANIAAHAAFNVIGFLFIVLVNS